MTRTRIALALTVLVAAAGAVTGAVALGQDVGEAATRAATLHTTEAPAEPTGRAGRLVELELVHPDDALADEADNAAQAAVTAPTAPARSSRTGTPHEAASAPTTAAAPVVEPITPAPLVVEEAPAPSCAAGEEFDGDRCVAVQRPEEAIGSARCDDPTLVVVAIVDGAYVCGPAADLAAPTA